MRSFQATVWPRFSAGACAEMPKGLAPEAMAASLANSSAAWIRALDGMQPTFRQVPPGFTASTMTVSRPSWPARMAQT